MTKNKIIPEIPKFIDFQIMNQNEQKNFLVSSLLPHINKTLNNELDKIKGWKHFTSWNNYLSIILSNCIIIIMWNYINNTELMQDILQRHDKMHIALKILFLPSFSHLATSLTKSILLPLGCNNSIDFISKREIKKHFNKFFTNEDKVNSLTTKIPDLNSWNDLFTIIKDPLENQVLKNLQHLGKIQLHEVIHQAFNPLINNQVYYQEDVSSIKNHSEEFIKEFLYNITKNKILTFDVDNYYKLSICSIITLFISEVISNNEEHQYISSITCTTILFILINCLTKYHSTISHCYGKIFHNQYIIEETKEKPIPIIDPEFLNKNNEIQKIIDESNTKSQLFFNLVNYYYNSTYLCIEKIFGNSELEILYHIKIFISDFISNFLEKHNNVDNNNDDDNDDDDDNEYESSFSGDSLQSTKINIDEILC